MTNSQRAGQLFDLYGVRFPDDLFEFWEWFNSLPPEAIDSLDEELGIWPVGPFDVLAGKFDGVELRYPAVLHWRYMFDPPEFFTILKGNTDGLHWGYWFDDPERLSPVISAFFASDSLELWSSGSTAFDAVRGHLNSVRESLRESIEYDPDDADNCEERLSALAELETLLPPRRSAPARIVTQPTPDLMGIVVPKGEGQGGELLARGKQKWFDNDPDRFDMLAQAYGELGRPALANVVRAHQRHPNLPRLDILQFRAGDYHSLAEAMADPERVVRLELGNARLTELPDMSRFLNLEELLLWGNHLTELPDSLVHCRKLREVNLHRNRLASIPNVLGKLESLAWLALSQNNIATIDHDLGGLPQLQELFLLGNPIPKSEHDQIRNLLPSVSITF